MCDNADQKLPKRKPNRLKGYDYSQNGAYFVTICVKNREKLLWDESLKENVGGDVLGAPLFELSCLGKTVEDQIKKMVNFYSDIKIEKYVIMPNHIHMLILVDNLNGTSGTPSPTGKSVSDFVSTFKRFCSRHIGKNLFQRSFHDHIVRDEEDYLKIWNYIDTNAVRWKDDCFYSE